MGKRFNPITVKWSATVSGMADKRAVLIIVDGMGDRPLIDHDYKTPLEYANTPTVDRIGKRRTSGLLSLISHGVGRSSRGVLRRRLL